MFKFTLSAQRVQITHRRVRGQALAVALLTASLSCASAPAVGPDQATCSGLANIARSAALARDAGLSLNQALELDNRRLQKDYQAARTTVKRTVVSVVHELIQRHIQQIHIQFQEETPEQIRLYFYLQCMGGLES